jgi:conjugative transfer region protein TrbK
MRALTVKGWSMLGACLVLAAVVLATVVSTLGPRPSASPASRVQNALANDVDRCSHLGESAESDPSCRAAWERARQQFLGAGTQGARP